MNVNEIIYELKQRQVIGEIPPKHHVRRRESEYINFIGRSEPYYFSRWEKDRDERPYENPNIGDFIWIPDGDVEFPEIDIKKIENKVIDEGLDALAWYRSFHWEPPEQWGIYIWDKGIYYIAQTIFKEIKQEGDYRRPFNALDLLQQSFKLLFLHEFFHFITDVAASTLEVGNFPPRHYYLQYVKNVYLNPRGQSEPIEEALANAFAFNRFRGRAIRGQLRVFMKKQPSGYSRFHKYLLKGTFTHGRRELGTCIRDGRCGKGMTPLEMLFDCYRRDLGFGDVPIYIVETIRDPRYVMKFIKSIPKSSIIKTPTFEKDLERVPDSIIPRYEKALHMLEYSVCHRALNFEKIKGCDVVFSFRINGGYRASIRPKDGKWELLRIAEHDKLYRNPVGR